MIWLIGNKGMLGTEVEKLLKRQQRDYLASDREIDITNGSAITGFAGDKTISWIINCAAYTAVDRAEEEPGLAIKINAEGPEHLARVAGEKKARLIHISTDYIFDGQKDEPCREMDLPNPACVYGISKLKGEKAIEACLGAHFIIRTAWLYGAGGPNFVATMLRLFREKSEVQVVADQWGSPTYAVDLAEAIMTIILSDSRAYGIYHFTNEGRISWYDFAVAIYRQARERYLLDREVTLTPITTEQYPTKAKRPRNSYLSKEKICRQFPISLKPWEESLATYLETIT